MIHPFKSFLDLIIPIAECHDDPLKDPDQVECDALAHPQPSKTPPGPLGEIDAQGQSSAVVADKIDHRSDMLTSHASQRPSAASIETISNLEEGNVGQNLSGKLDHSRIIVEDFGEMLPRTYQETVRDS